LGVREPFTAGRCIEAYRLGRGIGMALVGVVVSDWESGAFYADLNGNKTDVCREETVLRWAGETQSLMRMNKRAPSPRLLLGIEKSSGKDCLPVSVR